MVFICLIISRFFSCWSVQLSGKKSNGYYSSFSVKDGFGPLVSLLKQNCSILLGHIFTFCLPFLVTHVDVGLTV